MPALSRGGAPSVTTRSPCGWSPEPVRQKALLDTFHPSDSGVLMVVPGVANPQRAQMVIDNVDALRPRSCIVFTHKRCGDDERLDRMLDAGAAPVAQRCDVYRAPNGAGGGYVQHLKRVLPTFVEASRYEWILVLLDDVNATRMPLARLLRIARFNNLTFASPAVYGAHDDVARPRDEAKLRAMGAPPRTVGRVVRRIESFAWLMTPPMFRCLHSLIDPALNGVGWGYDHWLYLYCRSWPSVRFKAGVIDSLTVVHGLESEVEKEAESGGAKLPAMLSHTYSRREAQQAKQAMVADMASRGLLKLHPVDGHAHGWLADPDLIGDGMHSSASWTAIPQTRAPARRQLSMPLACVDDVSWQRRRSLHWEEAAAAASECTHTPYPQDREELWASLLAAGRAPSCEPSSLMKVRPAVFGGWWSTMHSLVKPLMHASRSGKALLTPNLPMWTDEVTCPNRSLGCLFLPLSRCDGRGGSGSASRVESLSAAGAWWKSLSQAQQRARGDIHLRGWFWWASNLLSFAMRPSPTLAASFAQALLRTGLGAALSSGKPVVGLHVRQGDSCGRDAARSARKCSPLTAYMDVVRRQTAGLDVTTIYLATDSEAVLHEALRDFSEYTWLHLPESLKLSAELNPANRKWDAVLKANREHGRTSQNMRLASVLSLDVMLLSKCDIFVGKHTSNFFRTAYELHAASCDCAAPFESLDAPWCFDWLVPAGDGVNGTAFEC